MRGKTNPIFPSFPSKLRRTALTYSRGPRVWLTLKLWLALCHPAKSCGDADGRSSRQRPEEPCSSQISPSCFFPNGCSPQAATELGEAQVLLLSISRERIGMTEGSAVLSVSSIQGTQSAIYRGGVPESAQPAPAYT